MKNEMKQQVLDSIASLRRELSASVLDGTPYLLVSDIPAKDGFVGYPAVYGEWPHRLGSHTFRQGWRSLDLMPHTCDGAFMYSPESADQHVRDLHSLGFRSARRVHRRDVLQARLAQSEQLFKDVFGEVA